METEATELSAPAPPPLRLPWVLAAALLTCVAAAVAGAVAGGVHSHVGHAPGAPGISQLVGDIAVATAVSVLVAGLVLALIARGPRRRREPKPGERVPGSRLERTLIHLAVFGLILAPLAALLMLFRDQSAAVERTPLRGLPGTGPGGGSGAPVHPAPHVEWTFFLALVVAALVILGFVAVMRRRALAEAEDDEPDDALAPVVAAGIEALESERDPRRAVIKAYAAMERTLAEQELPRKPAETPLEYLRRMLQDLGGRADPARRLTGLFEEAKFSAHVIDEPMRQDALTCLAALRGGAAA